MILLRKIWHLDPTIYNSQYGILLQQYL